MARVAAAQTVTLLEPGFAPAARVLPGRSGGNVNASGLSDQCRGQVPNVPQHRFATRSGFRQLRLFVQSSGDTTLVLRNGANIWCADDTYGLNPGLDVALPPGAYEVYVGSYSAGESYPYELVLTESTALQPGAVDPAAVAQPAPVAEGWVQPGAVVPPQVPREPSRALPLDTSTRPRFGQLTVTGVLTNDRNVSGRTVDATVNASAISGHGTCRGFVPATTSVNVTFRANQPFVRFFVRSAVDTTMVIQYPDGHVECSDDSFGTLHPSIEGPLDAGLYRLWVGVYREAEVHPFRLTITSDSNSHP